MYDLDQVSKTLKSRRLTLKKTLCYREFPSSESFLFSTRNPKHETLRNRPKMGSCESHVEE